VQPYKWETILIRESDVFYLTWQGLSTCQYNENNILILGGFGRKSDGSETYLND